MPRSQRTAEVFKWLSETDAEDARRMYGISEAALIKQKEYELCGKCIDPEKDVSRIGNSYAQGLTMAKQFGQHHLDYVEKKIVNDAAILVAILVINNRMPEAKQAAERLKGFVTDTRLSKKLELALDDALSGAVPTPWP